MTWSSKLQFLKVAVCIIYMWLCVRIQTFSLTTLIIVNLYFGEKYVIKEHDTWNGTMYVNNFIPLKFLLASFQAKRDFMTYKI